MTGSSVSASINNFPGKHTGLDGIRLHNCQDRWGKLADIIEPDGKNFLLARIGGELIELPESLSGQLQERLEQDRRSPGGEQHV